jgi:hypothetical protein
LCKSRAKQKQRLASRTTGVSADRRRPLGGPAPKRRCLRVRDDLPVVEDEDRDVALPCEPLGLPTTLGEIRKKRDAERLRHDRRLVASLSASWALLHG